MDASIKPEASAQLPQLTNRHRLLLQAIDRGDSYEEMWPVVCEMATELQSTEKPRLRLANLQTAFAQDESSGWPLKTLFHTIPRRLLRSVVLNTVALDLHDEHSPNWQDAYRPKSAGTYAVGLAVRDRGGKFLTLRETRALLDLLDQYEQAVRYMKAYRDDDVYGESQIPAGVMELIKTARAIDERFLEARHHWEEGDPLQMPRYASSAADPTMHIQALRAMLESRMLLPFDVDPDEPQIASPLYVGCGKAMEGRSLAHNPESSSGGHSSKILQLTQACMAYAGLLPVTVTVAVVRG
ncbi:hsp70-like protein [Apiospora arundinis]